MLMVLLCYAGKWEYFFTARFAQGAKFAEEKYIFFSADPRGIGFAFHRAGRAENKIRLRKNHNMVNSKHIYRRIELYSCRKALWFFVFLPLKGKQKRIKLSVLCVFAVNSIQTKTLLGSPSKPPLRDGG